MINPIVLPFYNWGQTICFCLDCLPTAFWAGTDCPLLCNFNLIQSLKLGLQILPLETGKTKKGVGKKKSELDVLPFPFPSCFVPSLTLSVLKRFGKCQAWVEVDCREAMQVLWRTGEYEWEKGTFVERYSEDYSKRLN